MERSEHHTGNVESRFLRKTSTVSLYQKSRTDHRGRMTLTNDPFSKNGVTLDGRSAGSSSGTSQTKGNIGDAGKTLQTK